ncbi:DUF6973 domain-containing protein [Paenibacillus alba]|uniref:DUF6973 domain-containing protein n=1 Tax=Paenibacillus alba TaxID=1197127 RepID=A0ABU6FWD5_9BACL|nr:hypothetical protein [Paenibacillus alba]MEC0226036.1 hypothetical protein [Paenibacillus alba]
MFFKKKIVKVLAITTILSSMYAGVASADLYSSFNEMANGNLGPTEQALCNSDSNKCTVALLAAQDASNNAKNEYPTELHNLRGDALRHAYWQASLTYSTSASYAEQWADAHELDHPGPVNENNMDTYNNSVGRDIASTGSLWNIISRLRSAIDNGDLLIIKNGNVVWSNE